MTLCCSGCRIRPHGLRVRHGGGEEAVPADAAVYPGPVVVPRPRVVHGPRDERVALVVGGVARPLLLAAVAVLAAADRVGPPAPVLLVRVDELVGVGAVAEASSDV